MKVENIMYTYLSICFMLRCTGLNAEIRLEKTAHSVDTLLP